MENKNTKKASILAFTLIMLSILLLAGLSLMGSVNVDQRASIDSRKSVQALQSAESGSAVMVSKIRNNISGTLNNLGTCSNGIISGTSSQGTYQVSFLNEDGDILDECSDNVEDIAKVKSIGTYAQTNRAVEVSIAAGTYKAIDYAQCEGKHGVTTTNITLTCSPGFRVVSYDSGTNVTASATYGGGVTSMNIRTALGDSITFTGKASPSMLCCKLVDVGN
jgi:Tfp pilus assembly protein PilX